MAYIRSTTKLPSGIDGWYIYFHVMGKVYVSSPNDAKNNYHTKEDLIVIRDILNEAIGDFEERSKRVLSGMKKLNEKLKTI